MTEKTENTAPYHRYPVVPVDLQTHELPALRGDLVETRSVPVPLAF